MITKSNRGQLSFFYNVLHACQWFLFVRPAPFIYARGEMSVVTEWVRVGLC